MFLFGVGGFEIAKQFLFYFGNIIPKHELFTEDLHSAIGIIYVSCCCIRQLSSLTFINSFFAGFANHKRCLFCLSCRMSTADQVISNLLKIT